MKSPMRYAAADMGMMMYGDEKLSKSVAMEKDLTRPQICPRDDTKQNVNAVKSTMPIVKEKTYSKRIGIVAKHATAM